VIVLDSDILTIMAWPGSARAQEAERALEQENDDVCSTIVNYEEQMRGWLAYLASAKTIAEQVERYGKLDRLVKLFSRLTLLGFGEKATTKFQSLKKSKIRVGVMDLKIASIALANGPRLATRNRGDFDKVPGLKILELFPE